MLVLVEGSHQEEVFSEAALGPKRLEQIMHGFVVLLTVGRAGRCWALPGGSGSAFVGPDFICASFWKCNCHRSCGTPGIDPHNARLMNGTSHRRVHGCAAGTQSCTASMTSGFASGTWNLRIGLAREGMENYYPETFIAPVQAPSLPGACTEGLLNNLFETRAARTFMRFKSSLKLVCPILTGDPTKSP